MYSSYEAKAKFSEVIRKVRAGQRIIIAYRGKEIAEILPIRTAGDSLQERLRSLEEQGGMIRGRGPIPVVQSIGRRPGALARFLEERD